MIRPLIQSAHTGGLSRRQVLRMGTLFIATSLSPSLGWSQHFNRSLKLHNALTGEDIKVEYWVEGEYVPDALKALNHFLRDPHNGKVTEIDPALFNLIRDIAGKLEAKGTINIMSGYRSPATNDRLRRRNSAAAKGSFHVKGKAVDIRIPGHRTNSVRRVALGLKQGGVGYYPSSKYVHIDTGPVRSWRHA
jgi:uncharacterized protein YcbK (DUF882 family)